jgi:hypothetical protein
MKRVMFLFHALLVAAAAPGLHAHHSFAAEFDVDRPLTLEGVVVEMQWVNPHSWLVIDVPNKDGSVERWRVEGGAPSALLRRGWNRNSLPPGTKVIVEAYQARSGENYVNARDITFPDGRKLFIGSSGTGAPYEREARQAEQPQAPKAAQP